MKTFKLATGLALVWFMTSTTSALAYLDPGTGSMILQGLIAGVAAGATVISLYYQKLRAKFSSILAKMTNADRK